MTTPPPLPPSCVGAGFTGTGSGVEPGGLPGTMTTGTPGSDVGGSAGAGVLPGPVFGSPTGVCVGASTVPGSFVVGVGGWLGPGSPGDGGRSGSIGPPNGV